MKKIKTPLALLMFVLCSCTAQEHKNESIIAFYNVENLFDTLDDPATYDEEFTPRGAYRYTDKVYHQKLHNIATVIGKLDAVIAGLAEIENNTVLNDLVAQPELKKHNYRYAWHDSPDPRGIDVALLYNPAFFKVIHTEAIPIRMQGMATRDVLYVHGILDGDTVHVMVNHWPSRSEGLRASAPKRRAAAVIAEKKTRRILSGNPESKIIIMGDMNDNPDDESISKVLGATGDKNGRLYNPWLALYQSGKGTSVYHRQWDHFDQIIISKAWIADTTGWHFETAEIFDADFTRNTKYEDAYPLRSFHGKNWVNGYSDHLPVFIRLSK